MSDLSDAAHAWDTIDVKKVRSVAWSSLKLIAESVDREFGGKHKPWTFVQEQLLKNHGGRFTKPQKGVVLLCGDMNSERKFFESGSKVKFDSVDGFDISGESLARYQPKKGLKFNARLVDCNYLQLPKDHYALAVAWQGAHHVYNLGNLFYQTNKSLTDSGLMFISEWIGPNRLQIPLINHLISSLLLLTLFSRQQRTTHMGNIKGRWVQPTPDFWEPSEACNSIELMPQFLNYFEPIASVPHGGLCYPIFEGIAQNLDQKDQLTAWKISFIYQLEKVLTKLRIIQPLFIIAVGKKKKNIF